MRSWRSTLSQMLREALAACPAASEMDTDALADHVFVTVEGAHTLSAPGTRSQDAPAAHRAPSAR